MLRVSVFLVTAALIAGMAGCGGDGYSRNLEIRDWYDLDAIRDNLGGNHILMNDLDSTTPGYVQLASPPANGGKGWEPIGTLDRFTGSFDGQGHEIRNLFIDRPEDWWTGVGLFDLVGEEGAIKDIGVVNATVTGNDWAGGLVAENRGTVDNSYFTGSVTSSSWNVGGLAGSNRGTVSNSYSNASVTGYVSVGGLVGANGGTVSDSYSTGSVTGDLGVGGLAGCQSGTMSNSYYNYDEVLINSENIITIGALFSENFEQWLANDKFLDVNERLSQENGYYLVNNVTDFKELLAFGQNASLKFRLKHDLDLGAEPNLYIPYLAGEFDGNGHKISNLSFNFDFVCHVGLFGYLASGGKVTQVGVENVNITGTSFVGGLAGYNHGTMSNSYATGSITGSATTTTISYEENVGGLVGANWKGTVSDSHFTGSVNGFREVGGLVGYNYQGTISSSYFTGSVTGYEHVGGLVGWTILGTVSDSYSTGNVSGHRSIGGLAGQNYGTVYNSYSAGNVSGSRSVGGLVGCNNHGTVYNSYSTGNVTGNEQVGGLVGWNEIYGTVNNSFWDTETSGQASSDGGTGKTTAQMKNIATFSGTGWNIIGVGSPGGRNPAYIWNIVDEETYPFLSWQS